MNKKAIWKSRLWLFLGLCALVSLGSCGDDDEPMLLPQPEVKDEGTHTRQAIKDMQGFGEEKADILRLTGVDEESFIAWSTSPAWILTTSQQLKLKDVRDRVSKPDEGTLLQKVIPLSDITTYMENTYGGTIGGFVAEAADVKSLYTMSDIYWGMRLDYEGTQFKPDGAGYAVIRYYSTMTDKLSIPYAPELGGTQPHEWPNSGGGFTASTLGEGGYPEWKTEGGYYPPKEGAELYEVTPMGREILRSVYKDGKWQTHESDKYPVVPASRSVKPGKAYVGVTCLYRGYSFMVRGKVGDKYHLTTYTRYPVEGLKQVERGVYGIEVPETEVTVSDSASARG